MYEGDREDQINKPIPNCELQEELLVMLQGDDVSSVVYPKVPKKLHSTKIYKHQIKEIIFKLYVKSMGKV